MINIRTARMLAHYKVWADGLTFEACRALPPAELVKERPTLFKTMIGTLNHIHVVDLIWQAHLEGRPHGFTARNRVLYPELDALWRAQQAIGDWAVAWSEAQSDTTLSEKVPFRFVNGSDGILSRGEIFLHIVTHALYHRGWLADLFFQVPAKLPQTDLSVYLCEAAPGRW